ncbi:hypothetical protein ScPMuIL_012722 [Solemya velum]
MYEGKNIHYSPADQKPLCSFSSKICNQRRLNGYAFCVRHILEDTTAPFKRCAYVAKSSKQTCTQPIPQHEERVYCNNHMQVLGMLPKKERKKKEKPEREREKEVDYFQDRERDKQESINSILLDRLSFQDRIKFKSKYSNTKLKPEVVRGSSIEDPDDPYAFPPDPVSDTGTKPNCLSPPQLSVDMLVLNSAISSTALNCNTKSPGETGAPTTSIAKMYPELAEKLERIKPKNEPKLKGKVKSSRTMNQLQTKIAQNKIKDKIKRNQESSCHSHSQSPSNGFSPSPSQGYDCISLTSSGQSPIAAPAISHPQLLTPNRTSPQIDPIMSHSDPLQIVPPDFMGFPHLAPAPLFHHPLPPPYVSTTSSSLLSPNLPHPPLYQFPSPTQPQQTPVPPLVSPHSHPSNLLPPPPPSLSTHIPHSISYPGNDVPFPNHPKSLPLEHSLPQPPPPQPLPPPPPPNLSIRSTMSNLLHHSPKSSPQVPALPVSPPQQVPLLNLPATTTHVTSTITTSSSSSPTISSTSVTSVISTTSVTSTERKPLLTSTSMPARSSVSQSHIYPTFTLPVARTRPRKAKNILMEKEAHRKLQMDSAVKYYSYYVRRRIMNHSFFNCGFCSSSDETDSDGELDMLPWQPNWFSASSDDEQNEDEEQDDDLRTTKLALLRARLRRQCSQSRKSYRANRSSVHFDRQETASLIRSAREKPSCATRALNEILHKSVRPVNKHKVNGVERRQCCYKNDEDVQCKNSVLPCTNHCLRHVMYNVDQQIFDYCTAKFADNTQCCMPVFDIKHELPLCMEHGIKADKYQEILESEPKPKKPRKKTKPSALTRPPKKGKKKKNQRKNTGLPNDSLLDGDLADTGKMVDNGWENSELSRPESDTQMSDHDGDEDEDQPPSSPVGKAEEPVPEEEPEKPLNSVSSDKTAMEEDKLPDELVALSQADIDKTLELPLEQASRLLEEQDFQEVFNKLPDEAFDIFSGTTPAFLAGKNGDYEPTKEEVDELERSLAEVNQDMRDVKDTFEKLSKVPAMSALMEDEDFAKQLTETLLNSNLPANNIELCNGLGEDLGRENLCKVNPSSLSVTSVVAGGHINSAGARHPQHLPQPVSPYSVSQSTIQAGPESSNGTLNSGNGLMGNMSMKTLPGGMAYFTPNSQAQPVADSSGVFSNRLLSASVNDTPVNQHPVPTERLNALSDYHGNSGLLAPQLVQLGHAAHSSQPSSRPQVTVSNHLHVETISANTLMLSQIREHTSMHTPSPSQSPLPSVRPPWPNINYQNGFPVGSAQYLHSNSGSSGPKFPTTATAQLNLSDYKQELTLSQYPTLLQHSINPSALRSHLHNFDSNQANFSAQNNYHSGSNAKS